MKMAEKKGALDVKAMMREIIKRKKRIAKGYGKR